MSDTRPVVATFHTTYLGYTETFIYEQLKRLRAVRPVPFALAVQHEERFPFADLVRRPRRGPLAWVPGWAERRLAPWVWWGMRRAKARAIHAHFGTAGVRALPYARRLGLPLVVSYYGFDVGFLLRPEQRPDFAWYVEGAERLFREAALHLALTEEMRGLLIALGAPPARVEVQRNGCDLQRFAPRARPSGPGMRVLLCGREVEKKGFSYGLAALAQAVREAPEISAELLGAGGPLRSALEEQARALGLGERLRFLPVGSSYAEALGRADVLLVPSVTAADGDREGLPTVIVEAAASGVPAIGTRHAGIPEIIKDGETGLVVEERDVAGLTRALLALARAPARRAGLGAAARALAEAEFDLDALCRRLDARYLALLGHPT